MTYSYYPGCTLKTKAKELDKWARRSAQALGVELEELLQPEQVIDLLPKNDLARYQQMLDRLPPFAQEMVIAGLEGAISQCLQVSKEW